MIPETIEKFSTFGIKVTEVTDDVLTYFKSDCDYLPLEVLSQIIAWEGFRAVSILDEHENLLTFEFKFN